MKMDKTRIGVSLCCAAALFGTVAYAVSPALAADTSGGSTSGTVLSATPYTNVSDEKNDESGRMAGIKILSGGEYVSTVDSAMLASTDEEVVISGEIGESYIVGDLIFEIVSKEEVQAAAADDLTRASTKRWSIDLSGDSMSKDFEVTSSYPYAKVWIDNDGSGDIKFTITKTSPTGTVVSGSNVSIPAGTTAVVYSSKKWSADTYYANFTSGKSSMSGTAACRVASTIEELDI